ncbi:MAG: HTTM domain-containing protein [Planctomycetaceae bacterium]|nr:HTTM domain-containing protein [Planctomycetaceae bacterium]
MIARIRWLLELAITFARDAVAATASAWNRFWFTPADPTTLCLIRVLAGLMLFYTHAVWTLDLEAFFGEHSWLSREVIAQANLDGYSWSVLSWCRSPAVLWTMHIVALATFALLTIGLWTRAAAVLAFVFTVSYAHRTPGALYGLDQINGLLSLYLMVGPSGSRFSVDAWRARRVARLSESSGHDQATRLGESSDVTANLAIRLMQCHLCVIYLFAGLSKLQGLSWWNGFAFWGGIANQEYQTLDLTWLADWPLVINALTHLTVAFELSYCVLIWNRWTRPLVLLVAVGLHLGIVFALGMPTFGLAMLIANVSFVDPSFLRTLIAGPAHRSAVISPASAAHSSTAAPHFQRAAKTKPRSGR